MKSKRYSIYNNNKEHEKCSKWSPWLAIIAGATTKKKRRKKGNKSPPKKNKSKTPTTTTLTTWLNYPEASDANKPPKRVSWKKIDTIIYTKQNEDSWSFSIP